ncbi:UDP-N-acetylglucosamine 1-carboxyvinyltransferase [Hymenobacter swuensis]|uniref:UDP-N-acetylglucosamine 1-carboxyvinyltransferase n=1 Tax=Hymenobacter swuensis DY53 TaxID=1227739 RepID=W8F6F1_9BACT|nr:UDP-N-acetylglucosamine 1-carboxyvinyltransferase [Hymenobacter swuensis]AHJ98206.1 UDP-N-acetylglucosamine 1-carboxyvinyltransferase [Hymenobacter swuensis DY53]
MASFEVIGGKPLKGEIVPQGAKNEALQILCAVLLTEEPVTISNIPDIRDVNKLIELLRDMGVKVGKLASDTYRFQADAVNLDYLDTPEFVAQAGALRGSVMILGPMLTRFGRCQLPKPGGDKIGRRPMDTHFLGLEKLGGKLTLEGLDFYRIKAENGLTGAYMMLDEASVTGTANILMAAALAKGTTTIYNAACEPYLQQLCKMLVRMGAKINGIGSNLLTIEGVERLGGTEHRMLPDMIEIGSFIGLAAMTGSEITIKDCQIPELGIIPDTFRKLGIQLEFRGDDIHIPAQDHYEIATYLDGSILTVSDHTWPGFTPDLLSIVLVVATQAKGTVLIHQKMFESRLFFVDKLIDMGAQVILCDPHRATVIGLDQQKRLHGITMTSPDIRAGVALLIAALSAEGRSVIENVEQIDRGYQYIDKRLTALGAQIRRL